ncbi:MAG: Uma2 family endonuclease [Chitinophagales bacterium]
MSAVSKKGETQYTLEEYWALEEKAEGKSEFYNGIIWAMSGGSLNHSAISSNTITALHNAVRAKGKKCRVMNSDLKVKIDKYNCVYFPDVMVICGDASYEENRTDTIKNPILIIEVLSPSTADFDRGTKFNRYRSLAYLQEYVLISQDKPKVEIWYREEKNLWRISNAIGLEAKFFLHSIDCEISLADIYYLIDDLEDVQLELDL